VEQLDLDGDGSLEIWIHSSSFSAVVSPNRGGTLEEYTLFESGVNHADVLTRRREVYHAPPPGDAPEHAPADGTPSIHDLEHSVRLERLPPVDRADRALFVDRVLPGDVTLDAFASGAFDTIASWAGVPFHASFEVSAHAVELVLQAGVLDKRMRFGPAGELTVSYRWDPAAFPADAFFCPEISVSGKVELDLAPAADLWSFPIATMSRSERGFEETVQGHSYTPRWPARSGEARVTLVQAT
jgi:4-alpha-glucanotransferase